MSEPVQRAPAPLRVALGTSALLGPLTGIGHYALQLAQGLQRRPDIDLTCFYGPVFSREILRKVPIAAAGRIRSVVRRWIPNSYGVRRGLEQWNFNRGQRTRQFDVYHEPNYLAMRFDGPTVITVHDLSWIRFPETHPVERVQAMDRYFEPAMSRAAVLLTDSEFVKREILEVYGGDPDRIVTVSLGLDPVFRPFTQDVTAPVLSRLSLHHGRYFLCVGTLEPRKNLQTAITAYAGLPAPVRARYPLVLAGMKGWRTTSLEDMLAPLVRRNEVRVLGYLERDDLAKVTAGALTLVYPSLYEGFGLPPLEAMGCGVPPIISTAGALLEVVGDCGLVVDPHDVPELTAAMVRMTEDARLREQLGAAALERSASFTWERCIEETVRAYRRAAATSR